MSHRRRAGLALAALLGIALLLRAAPLYWSPHPSTLDGFHYAASAHAMVASGAIPFPDRADDLFYTSLVAITGLVFETSTLRATQPAATVLGTGICVAGVALARRAVRESERLSVNASTVALAVAGLLAVEGVFLRRTTVPDSDIVGILFTLLVAFTLHYAYRTGYWRWYSITGLILLVFPTVHTFTTFIAAFVVTGLTARHVSRSLSVRSLVGGLVIAGGFWAYIAAYYRTAETALSLVVPYVDRVTAYPGLFVAWAIVLIIGIVWLQHTSGRIRQVTYLAVVGVFFGVVTLNAITPIYPGTAQTPQLILVLVATLGVVAVAAGFSLDLVEDYRSGVVLLALFCAPAAIIGFSLTASLTAEYFATALRAQTFLHFPVLAVAGVTIARLLARDTPSQDRQRIRITLAAVVVLATIATVPLAFVNMDTGSAPSTTLDSEYESVEFASTRLTAPWATDHSLSSVGGHSFGANASYTPTAEWLSGGASPRCPVVSQHSWTTSGAHLFPNAPETVPPREYATWTGTRNVVYTANGLDPVTVSIPRSGTAGC